MMGIGSDILSQLDAVRESGGGQAALDQWLASTSYTPAQLAAATGYNEADVSAAMGRATSQFDVGGGAGFTPAQSQAVIAQNSAQIQQDMAGLKTDAELNAYLNKTTYTPEQLAIATGYRVEDVTAKMQSAWQDRGLLNTQQWLDTAYKPTSQQAPTPGFSVGGGGSSSGGSGGSTGSSGSTGSTGSTVGSSGSGLIPIQTTKSQAYTPATPSPLQLIQTSESRVSNPAINSNAVSAVSGQPLNQSRFVNAAQPTNTGLLSMADTESYLKEMRARALANPNNVATVDRRSY